MQHSDHVGEAHRDRPVRRSPSVRRVLTVVLSVACGLAASGCTPGPPVTFAPRSGNTFIGAPGNFGI